MIDEDELWRKMGLSIAVVSLAWMAWDSQQKLNELAAENAQLADYIRTLKSYQQGYEESNEDRRN